MSSCMSYIYMNYIRMRYVRYGVTAQDADVY